MTIKTAALYTWISIISNSIAFCQNSEKVVFNTKDTSSGYYLATRPQTENIKGVVILLTSFLSPEKLLPETRLHS